MPAATKTTSTRDPAITQANLGDAIKTAFTAAGFGTAFDDYTSGVLSVKLVDTIAAI